MNKKKPSFCFIAPTNYLDFTTRSTTHLTLAHLVDKDPQYAKFYQLRAECEDLVIMDCSTYELKEPYSPDKLFDLAGMCGADVIVLPDYPFQPGTRTIKAAEQYIDSFHQAGFKTFFVPQSKRGDLKDWIESYTWAANNPKIHMIGMSILGIPNALPHIDPSYARVVMTQLLIDQGLFNFDKHHHYLGLNSGPALEIPSLINMNALDTVDSSGPIWAAILGHRYTYDADSYQTVSKLKMPVNFDIPLTKDEDTITRISHNIEMTVQLMEGAGSNKVWYANE